MDKSRYYEASALFRSVGSVLKESLKQQDALNDAGLMINRLTLQSSLMPTEELKGVKFADKRDLFLSGRRTPPYMKIRIALDVIAKE